MSFNKSSFLRQAGIPAFCAAVFVATTASAAASLLLQLNVYVLAGTAWKTDDVRNAVRTATQLLAQCDVTVAPPVFRVLDVPERFRYYSTVVSRELMRKLNPPKPAIFFVEDTRNQPAFDAETIGRANATSRPELSDTIWVAYGARDLPLALAHELVHLVSDTGEHSMEPGNLMRNETSPANVKLTHAQCARLRTRGTENGLLTAPLPHDREPGAYD